MDNLILINCLDTLDNLYSKIRDPNYYISDIHELLQISVYLQTTINRINWILNEYLNTDPKYD